MNRLHSIYTGLCSELAAIWSNLVETSLERLMPECCSIRNVVTFADFEGRWKMLHYFARNFFSMVIVKGHLLNDVGLDIYVISDHLEDITDVSVKISVYAFDSFIPLYVNTVTNITVSIS